MTFHVWLKQTVACIACLTWKRSKGPKVPRAQMTSSQGTVSESSLRHLELTARGFKDQAIHDLTKMMNLRNNNATTANRPAERHTQCPTRGQVLDRFCKHAGDRNRRHHHAAAHVFQGAAQVRPADVWIPCEEDSIREA